MLEQDFSPPFCKPPEKFTCMGAYHSTKLVTLDWFTRFALKSAIANVIM